MSAQSKRMSVRLAAAAAVAAVATSIAVVPAGAVALPAMPAEFQLTINTDAYNTPFHTTRHADGTWSSWDQVPDMYYNPGGTTSLTQTEHAGVTFLASNYAGQIQFLIRDTAGNWTSPTGTTAPIPGEVPIWHSGNTPATTPITKMLGSAFVDNEFHLIAQAGNGYPYEIVRHADGTWGDWTELAGQLGNIGTITDFSAATTNGSDLQFTAVAGGKLWHTKRATSVDAFTAWGDVFAVSSNPGTAEHVAAAGVSGELQVVVTGNNGAGVFHAIRHADGTWTRFGDVEAATRSNPGTVTGVGIAATNTLSTGPNLQVVVVNNTGGLFHTVRNSSGSWTTFGDVNANVPGSHAGHATTVSGAGE
ncbi:hypothetical protein [Kitasatospora cinereorecta]|uniref:Uncharacterized protein n=1 Tax=Kitasatospora cinereorecta TaxID=285560 RepID=A0ABW0VEL0_9ACTN